MAYQKQNFINYTVLTAEQLNHIEDGIVQNATDIQQIKDNGIGVNIEPSEDDIPKVFFGGSLPQTKNEEVMSFRYISKTTDISGYCKTKAQGNSSMAHPKKNQTVKLYRDAECTQKMKVNFKNWGEQNKFCFKANWIDLTHARNVVSARLWGDVVESRANYNTIPELLRTSPNYGAIDGFPVKVFANGIYQGRYTLNIPKDAWMANLDDTLDTHCILCGETNSSPCWFREEVLIDGSDWSDEIHDIVPSSILSRWNEIITFVANSTDEEFVANLDNYIDVQSLIDYYLFGTAICNFDGFGKNQLFITYDGSKWYASAYDLDSTYGLHWDGSYFLDYDHQISDGTSGNLLYIRLDNLFSDALKTRWGELRSSVLSIANVINEFERFTDICPPWLVAEDYATTTADGTFTEIPSKDTNNIQQIRDYVVNRFAWADAKFIDGDTDLVYKLENTTFDSSLSKPAINTGIQLFNVAQDSTVFVDFGGVSSQVSAGGTMIWTAENEWKDPCNGISIHTVASEYVEVRLNGKLTNICNTHATKWANTRAIAVVFTSGVPTLFKFKKTDGTTVSITLPDTMTYIASDGFIVLGGKHSINGDTNTRWNGVINDLRIWKRALSLDEVDELLSSVSLD